MEAMAYAPTCSLVKVTRRLDSRQGKLYAKSLWRWPVCLRPRLCTLQVECSISGMEQVKPFKASELQEKFGSDNLQFLEVGARTVVELKLNSGTSARLLLADARITSYNCRLWHGGLEEFLYTNVSDFGESSVDSHHEDSDDESTHGEEFFITGGMAPSLAYSLSPHRSLFDNNWFVQSVVVDPDEHVQVTLRCANENQGGWHIKLLNVITLTNQALISALLLTNKGRKPLVFTASVSTHLAIRATEAINCVGLDSCDYFSPSQAAVKAAQVNPFETLFGKLKRFMLPFQHDESKQTKTLEDVNEMQKQSAGNPEEDKTHWFTEKPDELVSVTNGVHKLYSDPPSQMRITDQGLRRSLLFENHGFENLEVSSADTDGDNPYLMVAYGTILSPITLEKGETWRGAQVLIPDTK